MAPSQVNSESACSEEQDEGRDLNASMFADGIPNSVAKEPNNNGAERKQNNPNNGHRNPVNKNELMYS